MSVYPVYIPWQDSEIFVAVARFGSFSEAARQLRLTQPTVSRRIASLEEHLGRALFRRDSEGTHLTREGEMLLPAAQQMERWSVEMQRAASGFEEAPRGVVRCAVPPGVAHDFMVPLAVRARERFADLRLELISGVEHLDLTRGSAELAIRTRPPRQAELMVIERYTSELGVFVAPRLRDRLRAEGVIEEESVEASRLPWVSWAAPLEHVWPRPFLEASLDPFTIGFASNDYLVQRRAVQQGLGAFITSKLRWPEQPGEPLVELRTELELAQEAVMYLVCARPMRFVPRVKAIVELIGERMEEMGRSSLA